MMIEDGSLVYGLLLGSGQMRVNELKQSEYLVYQNVSQKPLPYRSERIS